MMPTTVGSLQVLGVAFFSTRHASAQDVLAGRERPFTAPACGLLVGRARRFTSLVTQMHIEVCGSLQAESADPVAVFATCHGEIQTAERLITDFRESAMVSSARFALSVHNTASGVYSVATGNNAPTTTVTGVNAIAAGWLEASLTALDGERTVLLSIADEPVPPVFHGPAEPAGVAAAVLVRAGAGEGRTAELAVMPCDDEAEVSPLAVLARAADAWSRGEPSRVALGQIQRGARLELRFAEGARA
jgi:hypothetical protein